MCEQVDGDEEAMMLVEGRNVLDDNEIENEVTELEFEKIKLWMMGPLKKTYLASILDTVVEFLLLKKAKRLIWWFLDSLHILVST